MIRLNTTLTGLVTVMKKIGLLCVCIYIYIYWFIYYLFTNLYIYTYIYTHKSSSSVGIATRYRLESPEIESCWGRYFPHPSRPALGPTQPPTQWVPGLSGVNAAGRSWPPTPFRAEVKEIGQLYLCSLSELSWPVIGWYLNLTYI